ncbi:MAG TPA: beta-propeller fold lactonase family protein, partial [Acidobacteriaceae bacterium]
MKFRNWSQGFLAITVSAGIGLGLISCGQSSTIDYLYVASASTSVGVINTYLVDSQSGALNEVSGTPTNAGHNPVGLVTSPNGNNLFVINHDDNTLIAYTIGTGARLEQPTTYTLPGNAPVAVAMNPGGTLLFVVVSFAPSLSAADPGPGALLVYQVDTGSGKLTGPVTQTFGSAQSGNYYPLNTTPTGV